MFHLQSISARGNVVLHASIARGWYSPAVRLHCVKNGYHVMHQKTKVETIKASSTFRQFATFLHLRRSPARENVIKRPANLSSFEHRSLAYQPRMPRNFHHDQHSSSWCGLSSRSNPIIFARIIRCKSDSSSLSMASLKRGWNQSKPDTRYILAALILAGGVVYAYYRYCSSESLCHTEGNESKTVVKANSGLKESAEALTSLTFEEAVAQASDVCQRVKDETGSPGLLVAVSVDGEPVWAQGFGYADVENRLPCKPETVIRIASISKSITMTAVAKAMENGDLDLDKPVQVYAPQFPEKMVNGEKVTVTTRQLVSHMSGVRHYNKDYMTKNPTSTSDSSPSAPSKPEGKETMAKKAPGEFKEEECYIKEKYTSTEAGLALFKDDPLVHKPGTKFLYSSHAWTLVAAVLEGATKTKFPVLIRRLFRQLGLDNTYLDENEPLIYNRSRNYVRNEEGILINAAYVDCSYKYAGGGMLSTMTDLLQFANVMLYSYQFTESATGSNSTPEKEGKSDSTVEKNKTHGEGHTSAGTNARESSSQGYLRPSTVKQLWTPVELAKITEDGDICYGLGWKVHPGIRSSGPDGKKPMYVYHNGMAVGASSTLLILPRPDVGCENGGSNSSLPKGVCVAMAVNMIEVRLNKMALQIAQLFERVSEE